MNKSSLLAILCFLACASYGQVKFALQAGYNSAKWQLTVSERNWDANTGAVSGFNAGPLVQVELKKRFTLQGALLFSTGGTKLQHRYRWYSSSREIKVNTLHLPVVVMYGIDVKQMRFSLGGGLYAAYLLSGIEEGTTTRHEPGGSPVVNPIDNKIEFEPAGHPFEPASTAPIILERLDAGYVVMANIEYNRFLMLQVSYNGGLVGLLPDGYSFGGNFKSRMISFSLGVWLSRKK